MDPTTELADLATQVEDPVTPPSMAASLGLSLRIKHGGALEEEKAAAREEPQQPSVSFFVFIFSLR
jgi:hypothetical protein